MVTSFRYEWVEAHMDHHKQWNQLSKKQQLNCYCDKLARRVVRSTLNTYSPPFGKQVLPKESVAVFIGGVKQNSDVAKGARYALGLSDAKRFCTTLLGARDSQGRRHDDGGLGWTTTAIDAADWRSLDATLLSKLQRYNIWLAKQCLGFCGTKEMVRHWDPERDGRCPNCQQTENSQHLNLCDNRDRTRLLYEMVDNFAK